VKKPFLILCFFLGSTAIKAQFILNQDGEAFSTVPFFNAELIAAQHIKTIDGFYTYKKGNEAFKPSPDTYRYRFNAVGQLIASMEVLNKGTAKDSIFHHYAYHPDGQLSMHRFSAYGGALSEHYTYDSLERLVSVVLYRDIYDHKKDTLVSSVKMRAETLHYHKDQAADYTRFNNYQRPYLEVGNTFDAQHFLSSKTAYYRISQTSETTQYTYNQIGLLATKATFMDSTKVAKEEWRYRYDQWGNLIEMHKYENGTFMHDYQIVYDYKTGFLGSIIKKDLKSDQMSILRFTTYTYYPKP
jgi:YD repeat-containing protein